MGIVSSGARARSHFLGEFPEDLGATSNGIPASMWQMQQFQDTLLFPACQTFALFQCEFGASSPKPTRFISDLQNFEGLVHQGVPRFDKDWKYLGPLPNACPHPKAHEPLIGMDDQGNWRTGPAAHYPGELCKFLALAIAKSWSNASFAAVGDDPSMTLLGGDDPKTLHLEFLEETFLETSSSPTEEPLTIKSGCIGPPMKASYAGRSDDFCDGFGLCSPGRWNPNNRSALRTPAQLQFCKDLRRIIERFCERKVPDLGQSHFPVGSWEV